jgi:succinyl-CoA synthetase beta subunit
LTLKEKRNSQQKQNMNTLFFSTSGPSVRDSEAIARAINLGENRFQAFHDQLSRIYKLFVEKDALMIEINPFVELADGARKFRAAVLNCYMSFFFVFIHLIRVCALRSDVYGCQIKL